MICMQCRLSMGEKLWMLMERIENGEMRMLSDELRGVRLWHSGLERAGCVAVSVWKGLETHSIAGFEKIGRTVVLSLQKG